MKVAISGDLKGSRTIHSFVYALARFGATIDPLPAPGMELPAHVDRRLREETGLTHMISKTTGQTTGPIDALYVTADQPHQLSLYAEPEGDRLWPYPEAEDGRSVYDTLQGRWTREKAALSEDRRQISRPDENIRKPASCTRCRGSTNSTPRSIATGARYTLGRRPMACRCAWR